nr:hypothetical protein [Microbacterium azadirachtae]
MLLKKSLSIPALATVLLLVACSPKFSTPADAGTVTAAAKSGGTAAAEVAAVTSQPFNSGKLLGGNAAPNFPDGEAGKVSVVAQGTLAKSEGMNSGTLLFAYRNNTPAAISHVDFTVIAKADGKVVASGNSQSGGIPAQVQPGEAALDYIYFDNVASVPDAGVRYEFTVKTSPADTRSFNTAALKVAQADNNGTAIIGSATNDTDAVVHGPFSVYAYCFDGENLSQLIQDFAPETGDVAAGGQVAFTANLYSKTCDTFALGVSGWFK